jgi:hypothetical protein
MRFPTGKSLRWGWLIEGFHKPHEIRICTASSRDPVWRLVDNGVPVQKCDRMTHYNRKPAIFTSPV